MKNVKNIALILFILFLIVFGGVSYLLQKGSERALVEATNEFGKAAKFDFNYINKEADFINLLIKNHKLTLTNEEEKMVNEILDLTRFLK